MRFLGLLLLAAATLSAQKPHVSPAMMELISQRLDRRLGSMLPADDPVQQVGLTQGTYIDGFGVVFMGSLNLAPLGGISPFHQAFSKPEYARIHQKKVERLPKLRTVMQDMLLNMAVSMDTVPQDEQIAIAVALFSFTGEDVNGVPSQIVMHGIKRALIEMQTGRADRSGIRVEEF